MPMHIFAAPAPTPTTAGLTLLPLIEAQGTPLTARIPVTSSPSVWAAASAFLNLLDTETRQHSLRVARLASELAQLVDPDLELAELIFLGGLTHDVGKVSINPSTFLKPGPLSAEDVAALREHPRLGAELLRGYCFPEEMVSMAHYHHERFDGSGYPYGLSGSSIPFSSRLLAIVDSFDAVACARCYRSGAGARQALAEIVNCAAKDFDPRIVQALVSVVDRGHKSDRAPLPF